MSSGRPSREEAAAAVAEAGHRASQVHRADRQLAWVLAILTAADMAIAGLMSIPAHGIAAGVGPAVLATYAACIVLVGVVFFRIRAYSRAGLRLFISAAALFTTWNALVSGVSVATRWWGPAQPSYHFGLSALIGAIPLLVGVLLLARPVRE